MTLPGIGSRVLTMSRLFFIRIATPQEFVEPCEKYIGAPPSISQYLSSDILEWVSCKNIKSRYVCFKNSNKALRFTLPLMPLTLSVPILRDTDIKR